MGTMLMHGDLLLFKHASQPSPTNHNSHFLLCFLAVWEERIAELERTSVPLIKAAGPNSNKEYLKEKEVKESA